MRHTHKTIYNGRPVLVAMGFDIPLQGYFMTVEPVDENNPDTNKETGMIYSNLDEPELNDNMGFASDIKLYQRRLREMNIEVPDYFFAAVLAD